MIYVYSFILAFLAAGIKGFQHKNVIGGHRWTLFVTSFFMFVFNVATFTLVLTTSWTTAISGGLGAAFGIVFALDLHDWIFKKKLPVS